MPKVPTSLQLPIGPRIGRGAQLLMKLEEQRNSNLKNCALEQAKVMSLRHDSGRELEDGDKLFWDRAMPEAILSLLEANQGAEAACVAFLMREDGRHRRIAEQCAAKDDTYHRATFELGGLPVFYEPPAIRPMYAYVLLTSKTITGAWKVGIATRDHAGYDNTDISVSGEWREATSRLESLNLEKFNVTAVEAFEIVASSMAAQNDAKRPHAIRLNDSELATVLLALRQLERDGLSKENLKDIHPDHFEDCEALDPREIDDLCVRINS